MKKIDFSTITVFMICIIIFTFAIISGSNVSDFFDANSFYITFVGSLAAMLLTFSLDIVINSLKYINILFLKNSSNNAKLVYDFIQISKQSRSKGNIAIEDYADKHSDPLLNKGLNLILLNQPTAKIKKILKADINETTSNYEKSAVFFKKWAAYSPAFGMLGTVIGIIQMFNNMSIMSTLYYSFGKALLTTFYGLILANLIFTPVANRLMQKVESEEAKNKIILEGIIGIKENMNNRILRETLFSYLTKEECLEYSNISMYTANKPIRLVA